MKDTVYRWREREGLHAYEIGWVWKFKLSKVDEWVRAGGADNRGWETVLHDLKPQ